jgi:hypothetical protein
MKVITFGPLIFSPYLVALEGFLFWANFHTMMTKKLGNFHLKILNSKKKI